MHNCCILIDSQNLDKPVAIKLSLSFDTLVVLNFRPAAEFKRGGLLSRGFLCLINFCCMNVTVHLVFQIVSSYVSQENLPQLLDLSAA